LGIARKQDQITRHRCHHPFPIWVPEGPTSLLPCDLITFPSPGPLYSPGGASLCQGRTCLEFGLGDLSHGPPINPPSNRRVLEPTRWLVTDTRMCSRRPGGKVEGVVTKNVYINNRKPKNRQNRNKVKFSVLLVGYSVICCSA